MKAQGHKHWLFTAKRGGRRGSREEKGTTVFLPGWEEEKNASRALAAEDWAPAVTTSDDRTLKHASAHPGKQAV